MSKSLQDQLLLLGLARKKPGGKRPDKVTRGAHGQPASAKGQSGKKQPQKGAARASGKDEAAMSLDRAYALRKQEEQKQADTARKLKQEEVRRRRLLNKEIGSIVNTHRLNNPKAEMPRNFMYKGRIRKIYLTPEQLEAQQHEEWGRE